MGQIDTGQGNRFQTDNGCRGKVQPDIVQTDSGQGDRVQTGRGCAGKV